MENTYISGHHTSSYQAGIAFLAPLFGTLSGPRTVPTVSEQGSGQPDCQQGTREGLNPVGRRRVIDELKARLTGHLDTLGNLQSRGAG